MMKMPGHHLVVGALQLLGVIQALPVVGLHHVQLRRHRARIITDLEDDGFERRSTIPKLDSVTTSLCILLLIFVGFCRGC